MRTENVHIVGGAGGAGLHWVHTGASLVWDITTPARASTLEGKNAFMGKLKRCSTRPKLLPLLGCRVQHLGASFVSWVAQVQGQQAINQISCAAALPAARDGSTWGPEEGNKVGPRERMHLAALSQNPMYVPSCAPSNFRGILPPRYGTTHCKYWIG